MEPLQGATRSKHVLHCPLIEAEYVLNCATTKRLGYDDSYQAVVSHKETLHLFFFYNQSAIRLVKNLKFCQCTKQITL